MKHSIKNTLMSTMAMLFVFGLHQCSEPDPNPNPVNFKTSYPGARHFLNSRAPQSQTFTINLTNTKTITSANGWKYTFNPNSFKAISSGNWVNSNIRIELTEYASKADMIYSGITTASGNKILESGGMFNISASSDGSELYMAANYQVLIPTDNPRDDMRVFRGIEVSGQDSSINVNWVLPDSTQQGDSSFVPTDSTTKFYVVQLNFLSWCNLDRYRNAGTGSPVRLKIPEEYSVNNTQVYMIFDESSVVTLFWSGNDMEYNSGNYNLPDGWNIKLLVVSVKDGELYYELINSQTGPDHLEELTGLTLVTEEDLDAIIEGL